MVKRRNQTTRKKNLQRDVPKKNKKTTFEKVILFLMDVPCAIDPSLQPVGKERGTLPPARFYHNASREDISWN